MKKNRTIPFGYKMQNGVMEINEFEAKAVQKIFKMEKQKRISFGYRRNDMNEIVIYEEQAEVVKLIFELYSFDLSLAKISKHLEVYQISSPTNKPLWGRQIINNVLSNENYLGNFDYTQIVTEELWNAVQNKKNNKGYSVRYNQGKETV